MPVAIWTRKVSVVVGVVESILHSMRKIYTHKKTKNIWSMNSAIVVPTYFLSMSLSLHTSCDRHKHTHSTNRAFNSGKQASGLYIPQLAQLCWKHNEVSNVVQWSYFIWYNNYNAYSQKCHTYRHKTSINYTHTDARYLCKKRLTEKRNTQAIELMDYISCGHDTSRMTSAQSPNKEQISNSVPVPWLALSDNAHHYNVEPMRIYRCTTAITRTAPSKSSQSSSHKRHLKPPT